MLKQHKFKHNTKENKYKSYTTDPKVIHPLLSHPIMHHHLPLFPPPFLSLPSYLPLHPLSSLPSPLPTLPNSLIPLPNNLTDYIELWHMETKLINYQLN